MERISFPRILLSPNAGTTGLPPLLKFDHYQFQIFITIRYPSFENIGENYKPSDSVTYCARNLAATILTAQSSEFYVAITKSKTIDTC